MQQRMAVYLCMMNWEDPGRNLFCTTFRPCPSVRVYAVRTTTKSHSRLRPWAEIQTRNLHSSADRYTMTFGMNYEPCRIRMMGICPDLFILQRNVYPSVM
jgi:hypothetical protein